MSRKRKDDETGWIAFAPLTGATYRLGHQPSFEPGVDPDEPLPVDSRGMRSVRFFEEYGCESPFWSTNGYGPLESNELGLSVALDRRSREFMQFWTAHFRHDTGWDSKKNERASQRMGDYLLRDVQRELRGTNIIVIDER